MKKIFSFLLAAVMMAALLGGCGQQTKCEKNIDTAMGTVISQTVYVTGNSPTANRCPRQR